jgi:hypothetical protein
MGPCILSIFQYISNKMQRYTVYLYLETALHVSGGTSTHHQERIQLYLQHLVFVTPLLLSAAIVEELDPVWVCCGWRTPLGQSRPVMELLSSRQNSSVLLVLRLLYGTYLMTMYHLLHVSQHLLIGKQTNRTDPVKSRRVWPTIVLKNVRALVSLRISIRVFIIIVRGSSHVPLRGCLYLILMYHNRLVSPRLPRHDSPRLDSPRQD